MASEKKLCSARLKPKNSIWHSHHFRALGYCKQTKKISKNSWVEWFFFFFFPRRSGFKQQPYLKCCYPLVNITFLASSVYICRKLTPASERYCYFSQMCGYLKLKVDLKNVILTFSLILCRNIFVEESPKFISHGFSWREIFSDMKNRISVCLPCVSKNLNKWNFLITPR